MNKKLIALVEDDATFGKLFKGNMEMSGYSCEVYADSRSAYDGIVRKQGQYWFIGVDRTLNKSPEQGHDLVRFLRMADVTDPIIMITADTSRDAECNDLTQGADDYVTKPLDYSVLFARVNNIWKARGYYEDTLCRGALSLNLVTRMVSYRDTMCNEAPSDAVFKILAKLMGRLGKIYSFGELREALGEDNPDSINAVHKGIHSLRKLLASIGLADAVITHAKVGYALRDNI